jgi:uncharacterized membrane protein HdeD (DUF308 family)
MSTPFTTDVEKMLGRAGRAWGWVLTYGVITALLGVVALVWPGATLLVIAILFAAQIVVSGFFQFVVAFSIPGESGWLRALSALLAILSFVLGIFLFGHVVLSLVLLALLLGVYWMFHGIVQLFVAIGHSDLPARGWTIAHGIFGVIAGAIVVVVPGISLVALTIVLGVWLILFGGMLAGSAFTLRSKTHKAGQAMRAVTG